jgi:bacterioferritin
MDKQALIDMLNKDVADEHASIIRYLIHAYQVGEDTPFGSMLLSTAREEMWHMNWLADEVGEMGGEPQMEQGIYPHDPTSNASLLRSYIEWEAGLLVEYREQAAQVESPELKRILLQAGLESATHQRRFEEWLAKLGPAGEEPFETEEEAGFSAEMLKQFKGEVHEQYKLILQHLRHAFVFEEESCPVGSELELTAMRHMKHLSHFAEELAESGESLDFDYPEIDTSRSIKQALESDLALTHAARERFTQLDIEPELSKHPGLKTEVETMITRNDFLAATLQGLMGETEEVAEPEPEKSAAEPAPEPPSEEPPAPASPQFTVGSLIKKD